MSQHLRRALKVFREIDPQLEEQSKRLGVTCTKGCAACCYLLVGVTFAEVRAIAAHLIGELSPAQLSALRDELTAATPALVSLRSRDEYLLRRQPCTFLRSGEEPWSGACSIYAVRPLACRLHLVVSAPERCAPDAVRDVTFVDTRFAHVHASVRLADVDDERDTKYGPMAPFLVLAIEERLDGKAPSLLDLESWERKMERWGRLAAVQTSGAR
jgi:Fe-S-cluster containining protein